MLELLCAAARCGAAGTFAELTIHAARTLNTAPSALPQLQDADLRDAVFHGCSRELLAFLRRS